MRTRMRICPAIVVLLPACLAGSLSAEPLPSLDQAKKWNGECAAVLWKGQYTSVLPACMQAVDALERLAPEQGLLADALLHLGLMYSSQERYTLAEPLLQRSLKIREKFLVDRPHDVAENLYYLAGVHHYQGELGKAQPLYERSLQIVEEAMGINDPEVVNHINGLAHLYEMQGEYAKAEKLLLRSLTILKQTLGLNHANAARPKQLLGKLYMDRGEYDRAQGVLFDSLALREAYWGPQHPGVAYVLNDLASMYQRQGKCEQAVPRLSRSLAIMEASFGADNPNVASALALLGLCDFRLGRWKDSVQRWTRVLATREVSLRIALTEPRITALLDSIREEEDINYSLVLLPQTALQARSLALRTSLLRKGRAAEAGLMTGRALRDSMTSATQRQRFEQWQDLRVQRETLYLRGPGRNSALLHQRRLTELLHQIDAVEQELARDAPALAAWKVPQPDEIIAQVARRLPGHSILVEVVRMQPRLFAAIGASPKWAEPRYLALLLFPDQRVESIDLGLADPMDQAVAEFLLSVRHDSQDPLTAAQVLYRRVFAPLLTKLGSVQKLFLSLDGSLNLVPFAALHDGQRYLVDTQYEWVYLSSGRDLLRGSMGRSGQSLVVADPDYGQAATVFTTAAGQTRAVDERIRGLYDGAAGLPQLAYARQEGQKVADLIGARLLVGSEATETAIRQARAPAVLHLPTHGIILNESGSGDERSLAALANPSTRPMAYLNQMLGRSTDLSMSNSALALAGAAHALDAADAAHDGLLTAEEAQTLNLYGTQLVVLSACDTGRGSVKAGQGVYGLRRAFFVAGAETVVMSLWPVSDRGTASLMLEYYQLLLDKKNPRNRVGGLLEAMRKMKSRHPHPYYWAPFIALGRDEPLHIPR